MPGVQSHTDTYKKAVPAALCGGTANLVGPAVGLEAENGAIVTVYVYRTKSSAWYIYILV